MIIASFRQYFFTVFQQFYIVIFTGRNDALLAIIPAQKDKIAFDLMSFIYQPVE